MNIKTLLQLAASFGLFLTILATGITLLNKNLEAIKNSLSQNKKITPSVPQVPGLYYTMIGNYPEFGREKPDTRTRKRTKYTIEISNFDKQRSAVKFLKTLEKKGIDAFYTPLHNNNRVIYRIRKGIFDSKKEAKRVAQRLKNQLGSEGRIIKLN